MIKYFKRKLKDTIEVRNNQLSFETNGELGAEIARNDKRIKRLEFIVKILNKVKESKNG